MAPESAGSDSWLSAGEASHPLRREKPECEGKWDKAGGEKSYCANLHSYFGHGESTSLMWLTDCKTILLRAVFQYDLISQKKRGGTHLETIKRKQDKGRPGVC